MRGPDGREYVAVLERDEEGRMEIIYVPKGEEGQG